MSAPREVRERRAVIGWCLFVAAMVAALVAVWQWDQRWHSAPPNAASPATGAATRPLGEPHDRKARRPTAEVRRPETTCLGPQAHPWEIALIRRGGDGPDQEIVRTVIYEPDELPAGTSREALRVGGWLERGTGDWGYEEYADLDCYASRDERLIANSVARVLRDKPILVGVGVHFDAAVLSAMFQRHDLEPEPWHYSIVDLKAATWGWFQSQVGTISAEAPQLQLPMSSEKLAEALGVEPPASAERHTALGDARWAARWFDALTGGVQ